MNDNDIVIVEAVRTPVGRFRGSLAGVRADHMGALVLNALLDRTGISADQVSDVVFGCGRHCIRSCADHGCRRG